MSTITKSFKSEKSAIKFLDSLYKEYKYVTPIKVPISGIGEYQFNVIN